MAGPGCKELQGRTRTAISDPVLRPPESEEVLVSDE